MRSRRPKVLHPLAGRAMIDHLLATCSEVTPGRVTVVVPARGSEIQDHLAGRCHTVRQEQARGTGDALRSVGEEALSAGRVLVMNADSPLIRASTLRGLAQRQLESGAEAALLSVHDPSRDDGRVQRDPKGRFERIVEHRDAGPDELASAEINAGVYCFSGPPLWAALARLEPHNQAHELYLTDVFGHLAEVEVVTAADPDELIGINDRIQLARAQACLRRRLLEELMLSGVSVTDPASTWVDAGVVVGQDTVLEPFTRLLGQTRIGSDCVIGPFADVGDCEIGDRVRIDHAWLRQSSIGSDSDCGPFSKLRPGTHLGERVHVGSFAELVRSRVGRGSRVPHVSYLGDAEVGQDVNIGAGTITANYDGVNKNQTVIEDGAFIGVDTMLRAPVRVGRGGRTGAGSVVTRDVPEGATAVGMPARVLKREAKGGGGDP